jgi:S1-C subfamily serine protease
LYVDTNGSHSQAFKNLLDLRAQLREPGKIPINTSTISRPFLNSPVLYEFDSLFARRVKELSAATVRIEKINADNGEAFLNGNGVALSDRLIGTAGHVVPANYQRGVRVQTAAGLMHDVEVLARDDANDATILKAKEAIPDVRPVMLAEPGEVKIGAPVVMVGTPGTQAAVHAYPGRLLAVDKVSNLEGSVEKMLTDATGGPGTSGSPIMDLRTGRVFAFVNGGHSFSQIKDPYAGFRPPALTGFSSDAFRRLIERIGDGTLSLR